MNNDLVLLNKTTGEVLLKNIDIKELSKENLSNLSIAIRDTEKQLKKLKDLANTEIKERNRKGVKFTEFDVSEITRTTKKVDYKTMENDGVLDKYVSLNETTYEVVKIKKNAQYIEQLDNETEKSINSSMDDYKNDKTTILSNDKDVDKKL